jgi:uncharacterized protein DUF5979
MLRRCAAAGVSGVLAVMSYAVMVGAPASAGGGPSNKVEVTKVVRGQNIGAGYTVVVTCERLNETQTKTLVFGPEGGTETASVPFESTCTVVETHDGGASHVEVSGSPCEFNVGTVVESETCQVTVTNTFEPKAEEVGPAGPQGPPGETAVQPAQAVVSRGRFTG